MTKKWDLMLVFGFFDDAMSGNHQIQKPIKHDYVSRIHINAFNTLVKLKTSTTTFIRILNVFSKI